MNEHFFSIQNTNKQLYYSNIFLHIQIWEAVNLHKNFDIKQGQIREKSK